MPSLDDLGTSQVPSEAPSATDIVPFYSIAELGSSSHVKRTTVTELVAAGLSGDAEALRESLGLGEDDDVTFGSLTADHIVLEDSTGTTIPDNALGRKGDILHLGDQPVAQYNTRFVYADHVSTGAPGRTLIGSLPIPASYMVDDTYFQIQFRLNIGASPAKAHQIWMIWVDFNEGTDDTSGLAFCVGETRFGVLQMDGLFKIDSSGGLAYLDFFPPTAPLIYGSAASAAQTDTIKGKILEAPADILAIGIDGANAPLGVANNLNFYIQDFGASSTNSLDVSGVIGIGSIYEL